MRMSISVEIFADRCCRASQAYADPHGVSNCLRRESVFTIHEISKVILPAGTIAAGAKVLDILICCIHLYWGAGLICSGAQFPQSSHKQT